MAQFGIQGSNLMDYYNKGFVGPTGSEAANKQWYGRYRPQGPWGNMGKPAGSEGHQYGYDQYYEPDKSGFKSFWFGNAAGDDEWKGYYPTSSGEKFGAPDRRGYNLFSPLGQFTGQRAGTFGGAKTSMREMGQRYLGPSATGLAETEDESFGQRMRRLKQMPEWQEENLKGLSEGATGQLVASEFRPPNTKSDWAIGTVPPFSDTGQDVARMEANKALAYGQLEETDIKDIIEGAKQFDPSTEPGGWNQFRTDVESDLDTDDIGSILKNWFTQASGAQGAYSSAQSAITGQEQAIRDYTTQIEGQQADIGLAQEGVETSRAGLTDPMAGARAGLTQLGQQDLTKSYGSGFDYMGQDTASTRTKQDLLSTAQGAQRDLRQGITTQIGDVGLMGDTLTNMLSQYDPSTATGGEFSGTGIMADELARMQGELGTAAIGLTDMTTSLEKAFSDAETTYGAGSQDSFEKWYDEFWSGIQHQGQYDASSPF